VETPRTPVPENINMSNHGNSLFPAPQPEVPAPQFVKKEPSFNHYQAYTPPVLRAQAPSSPPSRSNLGIFGRMANSVGLGSGNTQVASKPDDEPVASYEKQSNYQLNGEINLKDSDYDIPAFLRRKK
jgi:hypothetical protein